MKIKRILAILFAALMMLSVIAACDSGDGGGGGGGTDNQGGGGSDNQGGGGGSSGGVKIGIVLPTRDEPRWLQDEAKFKELVGASSYEVEILFSAGDSNTERSNVETLITRGIEVLIICPHDGDAAGAAVQAARDAGVKVISYDRLITNTAAVDYYVTFDSIDVGANQGGYLVQNASGVGNPLYLYAGAASDNNAFLFFEGAWKQLQPKIADGTFIIMNSSEAEALSGTLDLTRDQMATIIAQITTDWNFEVAKSKAEDNIVANPPPAGANFLLAPNDGTARAIADAFAAAGAEYFVTGQDAEIPSVQYIIDGKQSMTVLKDVRTLASDAVAMAIQILDGGSPSTSGSYNNGTIDVPAKQTNVVVVTQSNVKAEVVDSGYHAASEFTGLD